jgi:hypothetical protein
VLPAGSPRARLALAGGLLLGGCARTAEPEPEVPDLVSGSVTEDQFDDVKHRTLSMFHAALAQAEYAHESQRAQPCAQAWRHLQAWLASGESGRTESARLFQTCGCCLELPEE